MCNVNNSCHLYLEVRFARVGSLLTLSKKLYIAQRARPEPDMLLERASGVTQTMLRENDQTASYHTTNDHVKPSIPQIMHQTRQLLGVEPNAVAQHAPPERHLTPTNQIVGGVFLHQARQEKIISCAHKFAQKLTHACRMARATGSVVRGTFKYTTRTDAVIH